MRLKTSLIIFIIGIVTIFIFYKEGALPVDSKNTTTKGFIISRGESVNQIVKKLHNEDLIRSRIVFFIIIKKLGIENQIQAGEFRLSPSMNAHQIALTLTKGSHDIWLTVIEGLRREEIAQHIAQNFNIPEGEFIKNSQEGYLFPDTYLIPKDATVEAILNIFARNFNKKYSPELQAQARRKGLTDKEVITLASLVEKEARSYNNKVKVASIILKRYKKGWGLDLDASVQYALGYQSQEKTWWKKNLTTADLQINSSYNTYKHSGLPSTPISNPGLDSIKAVLEADENTPYWFYINSKDGTTMHYATTAEEQQENIRKYLR